MKPIIPFALLGAFFAVGAAAKAASTTPVGYVTLDLAPNQFNLEGITLHNPTIAAGVIDAESSSSVTDNQINFTTLLTAGATYVLELSDGTIQEITSWSGGVLNTPSDITGSVVPATTAYTLRKASTVSDIFGASNSAGLTPTPDGDFSVADKILIPNAGGGFDTVAYFNDGAGTEGWLDDGGNLAADKPMVYGDGFYVQRVAGSPISLVVAGELKTETTAGVLASGFNYLNSVAPVGLTVGTSGLETYLSASSDGSFDTIDNILIPGVGGGFTTVFYFNDGAGTVGWLDDGGNLAADYDLSGGFLILNRGAAKPYVLGVPSSYGTL